MDKFLEILPRPSKDLTVGFVPTAADPYDNKWFVEDDWRKFRDVGFRLREIDLKDENFESLMNKFEGVNIIFVSGGNIFYLLEKVLQSGFDRVVRKLVNNGIIYAGSSAGTALACPNIEYVKYFDDPSKASKLRTFEALGLVNFIILPHCGEQDFKKEFEVYEKHRGEIKYKAVNLTNYEALIIDGNNYKVVKADA